MDIPYLSRVMAEAAFQQGMAARLRERKSAEAPDLALSGDEIFEKFIDVDRDFGKPQVILRVSLSMLGEKTALVSVLPSHPSEMVGAVESAGRAAADWCFDLLMRARHTAH